MKTMTLKEQNEASNLFKRIKIMLDYGKFSDDNDVMDYINNELNSEGRSILAESLNTLDEMFNHVKP